MRATTMSEIRAAIKERRDGAKFFGDDYAYEMGIYYDDISHGIEELWRHGYVRDVTGTFLSFANGYQCNTGDYTTFHVCQIYDLNSVSATKAATKDFGAFILNIGRWA